MRSRWYAINSDCQRRAQSIKAIATDEKARATASCDSFAGTERRRNSHILCFLLTRARVPPAGPPSQVHVPKLRAPAGVTSSASPIWGQSLCQSLVLLSALLIPHRRKGLRKLGGGQAQERASCCPIYVLVFPRSFQSLPLAVLPSSQNPKHGRVPPSLARSGATGDFRKA